LQIAVEAGVLIRGDELRLPFLYVNLKIF
jgi:hypothetical protein